MVGGTPTQPPTQPPTHTYFYHHQCPTSANDAVDSQFSERGVFGGRSPTTAEVGGLPQHLVTCVVSLVVASVRALVWHWW